MRKVKMWFMSEVGRPAGSGGDSDLVRAAAARKFGGTDFADLSASAQREALLEARAAKNGCPPL